MSAREDYRLAYQLLREQERLVDDFTEDGEFTSWLAGVAHIKITYLLLQIPEATRRKARRSRYEYKRL